VARVRLTTRRPRALERSGDDRRHEAERDYQRCVANERPESAANAAFKGGRGVSRSPAPTVMVLVPAAIWALCSGATCQARARQTGNVRLPWLYTHLRTDPAGPVPNPPQKSAGPPMGKAAGDQGRVTPAHAAAHPGAREMAEAGHHRLVCALPVGRARLAPPPHPSIARRAIAARSFRRRSLSPGRTGPHRPLSGGAARPAAWV